jgi:hypothetical protein
MDAADFSGPQSRGVQHGEAAIQLAARSLGGRSSVPTLPTRSGTHKPAVLRYFETREQISLRLTAEDWREWSAALYASQLRHCDDYCRLAPSTHAVAQHVPLSWIIQIS